MVELNPRNIFNCRKNVVESSLEDLHVLHAPKLASQFQLKADKLFVYVCTAESDQFDHGEWVLDVEHTRCQLQSMSKSAVTLTQKSFDVLVQHMRSHWHSNPKGKAATLNAHEASPKYVLQRWTTMPMFRPRKDKTR